jgi:hypothetical protein
VCGLNLARGLTTSAQPMDGSGPHGPGHGAQPSMRTGRSPHLGRPWRRGCRGLDNRCSATPAMAQAPVWRDLLAGDAPSGGVSSDWHGDDEAAEAGTSGGASKLAVASGGRWRSRPVLQHGEVK